MKLTMSSVYGAPGYSRAQLMLCRDDLLSVLRASETKDSSVGHATVVADILSGCLEVAIQAEGDTYDAAAALAARRLDQAIAMVTNESPSSLKELHSEYWCRKAPDICLTRAAQEASRATPASPGAKSEDRTYGYRLLLFRLIGMCGFAAATAFLATSAAHPGGPDILLIIAAVLSALLATAAWTYITVADVKASSEEARRPEDAER